MTSIDAVRLKTSDKSTVNREKASGNGVDKYFRMDHDQMMATPAPMIYKDNALLTVVTDYSVDYANGIISFVAIPASNTKLEFVYYWSVFTDAEIQQFLDESGANITIASARVLLAWAADAAKVAKRQTLSGGGGLGQVVIDTSVIAKELRATAQAYIDMEQSLGESIPADGLTEIPWTEALYNRSTDQSVIRDS